MSEGMDWGAYVRGTASRYVTHYLAHAEAHNQPTAADYDALEPELPTILAAMDRAYGEEGWEQVCRFAWALCKPVNGYLGVRGYWGQLRSRLGQALEAVRALGDRQSEATFIHNLAILAQRTGAEGYAEAWSLYRQSLDIKEDLGDRAGIAKTLLQLGTLAKKTGEYVEARRLYQQSLEIKEELRDQRGIAITLHNLGRLAQAMGEYTEAQRLYHQSLRIREELDDPRGIAITLGQFPLC